ncbi:phenylacetic acid catabolic protein [Bacteriovorax sp. BAL6_X]|uniref:1,2-phenylacetyl-CoA epoxidase subunit PaaC n=1 Tax=Bacteriovorax sp. BAL6_X TaxID=1201290 RepID=UPI0003860F20|nr:Phenylacetic acid catabolic protein [Bacteriovorax sp. BAL6_X]EPZ51136.1 phenylacetic acid catabolic protein [Bacteriovorax sp. BAL6_X]
MAAREYTQEELQLFEDIQNGKKFDKGDELPPLYKKALRNLLWMQHDSEYSGALGYAPWIEKAPTMQEKVVVAQIVKDEMRHASVCYRLLKGLGEDVDSHIEKSELGFKMPEDEAQIGFQRLKDDFRVNIFYYGINFWEDFILFNFLMDRAAGHQLEDTLDSSYLPWKKGIEGIYKEEIMHLAHGDKWIKILAEGENKEFLQERLNIWWPRVMNVFGSTKGRSNDLYVKLGLKKRTNAVVRDVFVKEVEELCQQAGLVLPVYDEDAQPQRQ